MPPLVPIDRDGPKSQQKNLLDRLNRKIASTKSKSKQRDIVMIGSDDFLNDGVNVKPVRGANLAEDSPNLSPPKVIKLNGRDPSRDKKVISFNPVEDNALIGDDQATAQMPFALRNLRKD